MGKGYYVSKGKKKKETRFLELEKLTGYKVLPKAHKDDMIGVSKVIFVSDDMAEKVVRKKVDKKLEYLLKMLKQLSEEGNGGEDSINRTLMDAEKFRMQLISKYIKYLGNTYYGLSLKKLDLIIQELRYKLYQIEFDKQMVYVENEEVEEKKEGKRGRLK